MHRRLFLILIFATVYYLDASAQLGVGASMGANFSYLIGKDRIEDAKRRIGICPGFHIDIPLVLESYLQIGAIYSQQGITVKIDQPKLHVQNPELEGLPPDSVFNGDYHYKYTEKRQINYIIIPITWKQKFGDFYTQAGPYIGIPISAKLTYTKDYIPNINASYDNTAFGDTSNYKTHIKEEKGSFVNNLRQYDVGAMFGVGVQVPLGNRIDVFICGNYKLGFFSIEEKIKNQSRHKVIRNQVFSVSAGFLLVNNRMSKTYKRHRR